MDAQTTADTLLHSLQEWGLDMFGLVGQVYDVASVMSSNRNGVQSKVAEKYPNTMYVRCRSHVLNLAMSSGCKAVQSIQDLFDVSKLTRFLNGSAKRKEIFFQTAVATDDSELLSALVECADEDEEDESAKTLGEES